MSPWFRRFLGLILLITTVGIATCQSLVKADAYPVFSVEAQVETGFSR